MVISQTGPEVAPEKMPSAETEVYIPSNKNFLVGYIYNLTSDISSLRVSINYRRKVNSQLADAIKEIKNKIVDNPNLKKEIREQNKAYQNGLKRLEKKKIENNEELEKLLERVEDKQHLCQVAMAELDTAEEYELPVMLK